MWNGYLKDAHRILSQIDRANETIRRVCRGEAQRLRLAFIGADLQNSLARTEQTQPDQFGLPKPPLII